jgi:hypothetical protein
MDGCAAPTVRQNTARSGTRDGEHDMTGRWAVVIGAAAAGVMALGAQTVLAGGDRAPDLKLSGRKTQSQADINHPGSPPRPKVVWVEASCGEFRGPPASPSEESAPPANLPDLGCHLSAEGKVMGDKLRHRLQARVDLPGPGVACKVDQESGALTTCHWFSGSRALMELKLREKTRKQVRKALLDGQKVEAEVTVRAKYASGKVETAKRTIKLVD